jgi:hypothetical protein
MVKTTTKQKTVDYEHRGIYCDLCEAEVPEGQATVSILPAIARTQGERYHGNDSHKIDICSVDCLVKNAAAAGLLLNTKILPDLRGKAEIKPREIDLGIFEQDKKDYYDTAVGKWPDVYKDQRAQKATSPPKYTR